jgi:hypothetical protein
MSLRRFGLTLVLTALLALAFAPAGATAASYGTQVRIDDGGPKGASGHLSSKQKKCLRGRRVTLWYENDATDDLEKIGADTTDAEGDWEVEESLFAGNYIARVAARVIFLHGMRHTCRAALSLKVHL